MATILNRAALDQSTALANTDVGEDNTQCLLGQEHVQEELQFISGRGQGDSRIGAVGKGKSSL